MLNDILLINKGHEKAARAIFDRAMTEMAGKYIITIAGEVATGKCEIAHVLAKLFHAEGKYAKLLHMDDYYKIPPRERTEWRQQHGLGSIGFEEYDWKRVERNLRDFRLGKKSAIPSVDLITGQVDKIITDFSEISILIINGLYSMKIAESNLKVFIEMTYKETLEEQIAEGKEVLDDFRMKVLEREHEVVQSLKKQAGFFVDFETNPEAFHL